MVRWKDLKLNQQMSKRDRFNFIMDYIDSNATTTETVEETQTGDIAVSVTDGTNGIGSVSVVLSVTGSETTYTGTTGGEGGCNIKDVPYGTYDVTATCDGYVTGESSITVDSASEELNITLTAQQVEEQVQTGDIAVSVTDGENGIGSVSVVLSTTGSETTYTGTTDGEGGCNITNVPYGTYDVTATKEGYVTGETTITVDGASEELSITLTAQEQQTEEPTG